MQNPLDFYRNLDRKFKVVFWFIVIDIIIIIIVAIFYFTYRLNNEPSNITINNWDEYASDVPQGLHKATESEIYSILTNYNKIPTDVTADALIRDGTYSAINSSDNINVNFIVDLESLQQSFEVKFSYNTTVKSSNSNNFQIEVTCPRSSDIKYPNTKCLASNNPFNEVTKYLPYTGQLPRSGAKVTIKKQTYGSSSEHAGSQYLGVSVTSCDNFEIVQEGKEFIKSWLEERYLDPNDFYYEVFNTCAV